jgi:hypothetical protein
LKIRPKVDENLDVQVERELKMGRQNGNNFDTDSGDIDKNINDVGKSIISLLNSQFSLKINKMYNENYSKI